MNIKFPHITVQLSGRDGNALAIVGAVIRALRKGGVGPRDIDDYQAAALSGDYDHLLSVTMDTVEID